MMGFFETLERKAYNKFKGLFDGRASPPYSDGYMFGVGATIEALKEMVVEEKHPCPKCGANLAVRPIPPGLHICLGGEDERFFEAVRGRALADALFSERELQEPRRRFLRGIDSAIKAFKEMAKEEE